MKKMCTFSILFLVLLTGCGCSGIFKPNNTNSTLETNNKEISSKLLPLRHTPVSVFDLALVRAELALNRMLYTEYHNPYSLAVVTYRENKNIIDINIMPWAFTTDEEAAKKDSTTYYFIKNEAQAKAKMEEIFDIAEALIGDQGNAYLQFLYGIGGAYFKENEKEICKELGRITEISVKAYYYEKDKTYYLSLSGSLGGEREYKKKFHNSQ